MATTGISSSGTDFIGLYDSLKEVYDKPFENNIEGETEVWKALVEGGRLRSEDLGGDGRGIIIDHTFSYGGGVYMMGESDYFGGSGTPTTVRSTTTSRRWPLSRRCPAA
jgi:hypothetical protein